MSVHGCFHHFCRRLVSQETIPLLENSKLYKKKLRKVKSRDDAYSVDNILIFNDTHFPMVNPPAISIWITQPHTEVTCGENHVLIGIGASIYREYQQGMSLCSDLTSLYCYTRRMCNDISGTLIENMSWLELSRQQVTKDLIREEVIINGQYFSEAPDTNSLKNFLMDRISVFSRGKLASLAIIRHLLCFFSRTESGGDLFTVIHDLMPATTLVATVSNTNNPIIVVIAPSAHITIDTYNVFRISCDVMENKYSLLSQFTRSAFAPSVTSSVDDEIDTRGSFVVVCLMRCDLFYSTGDLQGVEVRRQLFFKAVTNRKFNRTKRLDEFFELPLPSYTCINGTLPIYYDVDCRQRNLNLVMNLEVDSEGREILVVEEVDHRRQIHPNIAPGHVFVSINGIPLQGHPHSVLINTIKVTPRPCVLRICSFSI